MAPEMLLEGEGGATARASRSTDVYALGVLCWEVLTGKLPWEGATEQKMVTALVQAAQAAHTRGEALPLPRGVPLATPPLPMDLPPAIKALLEHCLSADRDARPRIDAVELALHQAAQAMASGEFDVFLSHAWTEAGRHALLTTEVYRRLTDAGLRVWLDAAEMGADPTESMKDGIRRSKCVVALLNARYGTRPNCLRELTWAQEMGKPVVGCLAEAREGWFLSETLRTLLPPEVHLFPDLRAAAGVDWAAGEALGEGQRELLTKAPSALPLVLKLAGQLAGRSKGELLEEAEALTTLPHGNMTIAQVLAQMQAGQGDARVAEAGAQALVTLTGGAGLMAERREALLRQVHANIEARSQECIDCGGTEVLTAILKTHVDIAGVARYGCIALKNILSSPAAQERCVATAAPAIVAVLNAHPRDADIAQYGSWALWSLAANTGNSACVSAGAVQAVVAALNTHVDVVGVASFCCRALMNLARSGNGQDACLQGGAVPAVIAALVAHMRVADVAEYGCGALGKFTEYSDAAINKSVAAGAVQAVLTALSVHSGAEGVAINGCAALANFAAMGSTRDEGVFVSIDAVPAVLGSLTAHASGAGVAKMASMALSSISSISPSHRDAIISAGAVPLLAAAFVTHSGDVRASVHEALAKLGYTGAGKRGAEVGQGGAQGASRGRI